MSGSFLMYKHMWIERKLSDFELRGLCGALVHDTPFDQPLKPWQFVKPTPEKRFKVGVVPQEPLIKLGKKEHIDAFFESGALQLGSYAYYNAFDHPEIGDNQEGIVTLLAKTPFGVIGGKYGSGYNQRMFCVSVGDLDRRTMERFGYDSGFVINNPMGFANAVAESIGAASHTFGRCLYRPHKAVLGFPGDTVNRHEISHRTGEIVDAAKHFIKSERYAHQKEFRFLWEQSSDVSGADVFDCSSARQYCSPLSLGAR
ncbi:hypothetical protein I6J77_13670 [Rhodanobacter sp. FDAARGOS 1247]|uniref:hypothetical protein n=1 Tax=Rhodanobacter sp. FDAARGOS 1247 TaxID=2778082 RepID=UPI00194E9B0A|nr:hypothetical protein [Rhodanobacter sp. FDAARGOS 1247]QRP63155.1 hypothetical protein I6J77_13670 [Rhodanobacter sp. FDAARGOS 1247]